MLRAVMLGFSCRGRFVLRLALGIALVWIWTVPAIAIAPKQLDANILKSLPDECMLLLVGAGFDAPNAASANHAEQFFAHAEVRKFSQAIQQWITALMNQPGDESQSDDKQFERELVQWLATIAGRPFAAYLAEFGVDESGKPNHIDGGVIVRLDDQLPAFETWIQERMAALPADRREEGKLGNLSYTRLNPPSNGPPIYFATAGSFAMLTVGEESLAKLRERARTDTPGWFTNLYENRSVPRLAYTLVFNPDKLEPLVPQVPDPEFARTWSALGLKDTESMSLMFGLDDQECLTHCQIRRKAGVKGGMLNDATPLKAADLARIPVNASNATVLNIGLERFYRGFIEMLQQMEEEPVRDIERMLDDFKATTGVDLPQDILANLGDRIVVYQAGVGMMGIPNYVVSISVRNRDKLVAAEVRLREAATRLMKENLVAATIDQLSLGEHEVFYVSPAQVPIRPCWCITNDEIVIALAASTLQEHLTARAESKSLAQAYGIPKVLTAKNPPIALGYNDTPASLKSMLQSIPMLLPMISPGLQEQGIEVDPTVFPTWKGIGSIVKPSVWSIHRTDDGFEWLRRETIPGSAAFSSASPTTVALLLPAVQAARAAARRQQSMINLREIGLSILNYESANRRLPSRSMIWKEQHPGLSWRVAMLPYLEEQALFDEFHLDEPWDSEHNRKLIARIPKVFVSPTGKADAGMTTYLAVAGNDALLDAEKENRIQDVTDGLSHTLLVVEVDDALAVEWTKPSDFEWDSANPHQGLGEQHNGGFMGLFGDGSVTFLLNEDIRGETLEAMFTKSGGEVVSMPSP